MPDAPINAIDKLAESARQRLGLLVVELRLHNLVDGGSKGNIVAIWIGEAVVEVLNILFI